MPILVFKNILFSGQIQSQDTQYRLDLWALPNSAGFICALPVYSIQSFSVRLQQSNAFKDLNGSIKANDNGT